VNPFRGLVVLSGIAVFVSGAVLLASQGERAGLAAVGSIEPGILSLSSVAFKDGARIPEQYLCDGEKISPPLSISNPPLDTAAFTLIVSDSETITSTSTIYWSLFNIPRGTRAFIEGTGALGLQGVSYTGAAGYQAPCRSEKSGVFFVLFAHDQLLLAPEQATTTALLAALKGHVLDTSVLYARTQ
jgi:phosphatidylethanolamine-binding protein (PEBP) family uncharacterized protein